MLFLQALLPLGLLLPRVMSETSFINPPPAGENRDYSHDQVWELGSQVTLAWSGTVDDVPLSLALYQQVPEDDLVGSTQEPILPATLGTSTYNWFVSTSKNLTYSNVFYFLIFLNLSTEVDSTSHYFNITTASSTTTTSTTTSSFTISSTTTTSSSTIESSTSLTSSSASVAPTESSAPTTGLSSGATIGISVGVAVPVSSIVGAVACWLIIRRRKTNTESPETQQAPDPKPDNGGGHNFMPVRDLRSSYGSPPPWELGCESAAGYGRAYELHSSP